MPLDFRILRVTFEDEGVIDVFEKDAITVKGQRTGSWVQNQAEITIANIDKDVRDRLATKYRPENQLSRERIEKKGFVFVDVGRDSYGTFRLFEGNIMLIGLTPPPDIQLIVTVNSNYFSKSELASKNFGDINTVKGIADSISKDMELELDFQVENDISVGNLTYYGDVAGQVRLLSDMPYIDAYVDNGKLVVKDTGSPVSENPIYINVDTEMIGIPKFTDAGINVTILIKAGVRVGSLIRIRSEKYPATNGDYVIVSLGIDAANRDSPFYYEIFGTLRRGNG